MPEITPEALNHAISQASLGLGIDEIVARFGEEASRRMRAHMLNAASAIGRYIASQTKAAG